MTYDLLPIDAVETIVRLAHDRGRPRLCRQCAVHGLVLPLSASRGCSNSGADLGVTGLDKYGTKGPRLGLLAGRKDLFGRIRVRGFEFGMEARQMAYPAVVRTLEQYDPARVRSLIATTKQIADELRPLLGNRLRETPATVQIAAEDILEIAMERGGIGEPTVVPYEASAALSMLLLRHFGMLMVHFVGVPPGTVDLLIKFVPPETLERFGGAAKYAEAVNRSLARLGEFAPRSEEHSRAAARKAVVSILHTGRAKNGRNSKLGSIASNWGGSNSAVFHLPSEN